MYHLYIVRCADDTLYTGITTDLERRIVEHNESPKGARYTRARRPVTLVYSKKCRNRISASKQEWNIKQMTREQKNELVSSCNN
jgi:putative endonuclease